jgi:PDZ domain
MISAGYIRFTPVLRLQGSAADSAGIHQGDELLAVDGASISSATPYQVLLAVTLPMSFCSKPHPACVPCNAALPL